MPSDGARVVLEPAVAGLLNRSFVAVKVDREERPDRCRFHAFCGGDYRKRWLAHKRVLTPDIKPFFDGTYFPPVDRCDIPGLMTLLPRVAGLWKDGRAKLVQSSNQITAQLSASGSDVASSRQPILLQQTFKRMQRSFDAQHGGFGGAPKFPRPLALEFLMRYGHDQNSPEALAMTGAARPVLADTGRGHGRHQP